MGNGAGPLLLPPFAPGAAFLDLTGHAALHTLSNADAGLCLRNGYQEIKTPLIYNKGLWEIQRPLGKYRENMFLHPGQRDRPSTTRRSSRMNCPRTTCLLDEEATATGASRCASHQDVLHRNEATGC